MNSFNSFSLDPPLVLWSLSATRPSMPVFEACEYDAIIVLTENQQALWQLFASRSDDKLAQLGFDQGLGGAPLLRGYCACFQCRSTYRYPGGDHILLVSVVVNFDRDECPPLLYFAGAYRRLAP